MKNIKIIRLKFMLYTEQTIGYGWDMDPTQLKSMKIKSII